MKKHNLIGTILGIGLVFVLIGTMVGGLLASLEPAPCTAAQAGTSALTGMDDGETANSNLLGNIATEFDVYATNGEALEDSLSACWSSPVTIVSDSGSWSGGSNPCIAVDGDGNWHMVYGDSYISGGGACLHTYIKYINNTSGPHVIAEATTCGGSGGQVSSPSVDIDQNGTLHVIYGYVGGGGWAIEYIRRSGPRLCVIIPGVGFGDDEEHGERMFDLSMEVFRYAAECYVGVTEVGALSEQGVREKIAEAAMNAKQMEKDVIVNIDMDLDNFSLVWDYIFGNKRWRRSVDWAGGMANIVSDAFTDEFTDECPSGTRHLFAHSAGVDAASQSVKLRSGTKMYDELVLLNGRTLADRLRQALVKGGYSLWEVKVFTVDGDLWGFPVSFLASLSSYSGANRWAGKAWVHVHCRDETDHPHNTLLLHPFETYEFEANLGSLGKWTKSGTSWEMMSKDWETMYDQGMPGWTP